MEDLSKAEAEIRRLFKHELSENHQRFKCASLHGVIENLSMRHEEDIVTLLPFVMIGVLDELKDGKIPDDLELVYFILDGLSEDDEFSKIANQIRNLLSLDKRKILRDWLILIRESDLEVYANEELVSCINYWD